MIMEPLNGNVIAKKIDFNGKTKSGIILYGASNERTHIAEVINVGDGDTCIKEGDTIIFPKEFGIEVSIESNEYIIVRSLDILAIINHKQ